MTWKADTVEGELSTGTAFEVTWGTTVKIGFPGTLNMRARGDAGSVTPEPVIIEEEE